jgi:hypothetical protein
VCQATGSGMRRHDRDESPINDHQGFWETISFTTQGRIKFIVSTSIVKPYSFFTRYLVCPRLDLRYLPYLCSISLPTNINQLVIVISYPCDLVTCLQAMLIWYYRVGPLVSFHQRMYKSHYWLIRLNLPHWNTWATPLWLPCYGVAVDDIKAAAGDRD